MSSYGRVIAVRACDGDVVLTQGYATLYREAQRAARRRPSYRGDMELVLRAASALVWIYAAFQLASCI